jgi:hypothetical protein
MSGPSDHPALDGHAPEDEPTTLVHASPPPHDEEMTTIVHADPGAHEDEATTIVMADPGAAEDEATTLVHADPDAGEDERTTILAGAWQDAPEDDRTTIVPAAETPPDQAAHPPAAPPGAPASVAEAGDVTEIRQAIAGEPPGPDRDWFGARLADFTGALRQKQDGARRTAEETQTLAMAARDMIARVAMHVPRQAAEGWAADTVLQPDQLLANTYIVRSLIARGGIGEIYRTRHRDLRTEHAIKVLLPRYALDPTVLTLMLDEARLLQMVRHEAVVGCQDLLRDADGRPMLVMDYLRGRTLSSRLREGRLSPAELLVLARRLGEGLAAIHAAGIVHQDISPDNVILADDSCSAATIIDFGLARRLGGKGGMHRNLDFAGKFSWSSPEQLSGRPAAVDARSDLYSLGLMLAAAARGFRLDMGTDLESARAARTTVPSLAGIEQPVAGLIEALLAPNPAARLGSAAEIGPLLDRGGGGRWRQLLRYLGLRVA